MTDWYVHPCKEYTGGGDAALDAIDGSILKENDACLLVKSSTGNASIHYIDEDSAAAESSPDTISPDANAGNKRWKRAKVLTDASVVDFLQSGTGAAIRSAQSKMRDWLSVRDFGAVGDGSTNDAAAVQAAITAALAAGAGVYFPDGVYKITSSLNINRTVDATHTKFILRGSGAVLYVTSALTMFTSTTVDATSPVSENIEFQGLTFRGATASDAAYVLEGIKFLRVSFISCMFDKMKCLTSGRYIQTFSFVNCYMKWWAGEFITATDGVYDVAVIGCWAEAGGTFINATPAGVRAVAGLRLIGNLIEGLVNRVLTAGLCYGLTISGNYFEANGSDHANSSIDLSGGANLGVVITGNYISVEATNAASGTYYEIDLGTCDKIISGGNFCDARLYDNTSAPSLDDSNDNANTVVSKYPSSGGFYFDLTGCTSTPQGTAYYVRKGNLVTINIPTITATSNATSATLTGLPTWLTPARANVLPVRIIDNGAYAFGLITIAADGTVTLYVDAGGNVFTNSGTKGIVNTTISYLLS